MKSPVINVVLSSLVLGFLLSGCTSEMPKGSAQSLYTIADTLEVTKGDLGKSIQLKLNQKLLLNFESDPAQLGNWELVQYDNRTLLLLSENPRLPSENWGRLFQARVLGFAEIELRFVPQDENIPVQKHRFSISITR